MNRIALALLITATWSSAALAECAGSSATDKCLVGDWLMTEGGPMAWMKKQASQAGAAIEFTEFTQKPVDPDGAMHFKADGTYSVDPIRTRMVGKGGEAGGPTMTMEVNNVASSSGRWSVSGGTLNLCADTQTFDGSTKISMAGMTQELPTRNPGTQDVAFQYSCQGARFETRMQYEGSEDMVSTFSRK